ncbi:MAG: ABC-2 transporter permease [Woeseiaceae bacterium]|nr:ABC-2 transporter permease [Woeseiaceae bacterium]
MNRCKSSVNCARPRWPTCLSQRSRGRPHDHTSVGIIAARALGAPFNLPDASRNRGPGCTDVDNRPAIVSAFDQVVDIAILGSSNLGERERAAAVSGVIAAVSALFIMAMAVLTIFYLLDSLYAERRDRSILFWRSLPVTDSETVASKLLTALFVIPVITFGVVVLTHLVVLAISGIWIESRGGDAVHLIWSAAPLASNWLATLIILLALPLWYLPFGGWFLFVSAWTKRSPFVMAILPLLVLPMLERILLPTHLFRDAIFGRFSEMPLFRGNSGAGMMFGDADEFRIAGDADVTLLAFLDVPAFLASQSLWIGLVVGLLFTAAAIYVRRYRDES